MRISFTKMQGAGNDFVVLDETRGLLGLSAAQYRFLADRHFGVGADQILSVRPSPAEGIDFEYVIHNADGGEVEQCGNGSRCFLRFVRDKGLTTKDAVRVKTLSGVIEPRLQADGRVRVDMGAPIFELAQVPFVTDGLMPITVNTWQKWPLGQVLTAPHAPVLVAVLSMGNPHAVQLVDDVEAAPVAQMGPLIETGVRFPRRVNAGFMQVARGGNTLDAHRLIHLGADRGVQDAVKERFFQAYLTEGERIGDPETLVRLGAEAGPNRAG